MCKTDLETSAYLVLYGSLMSCFNTQDELRIRTKLKLLKLCELPGRLYDLGAYPGFINDQDHQGLVFAELHEIIDKQALTILDEFEDYRQAEISQSLYLRTLVNLQQPDIKAWVYIYNRPVIESGYIKSGSWLAHLKDRK